jgi:hypothetical protein
MAVYLGVSRTLSLLDSKIKEKSFWCIHPRSQPVQPGDYLLLYVPVTVSKTKNGIKQIYLITTGATAIARSECSNRNMVSVETQLLLTLSNGITIREMKRDRIVREWGAIGRNMQGVTFSINHTIWSRLKSLIAIKNPDAAPLLNDISGTLESARNSAPKDVEKT